MDKEILVEKITLWDNFVSSTDKEYINQNANLLADKIISCRSDIRSAIEIWLDNRTITHLSVDKLTEQMLVEQARMSYVAAYLTLDWVQRVGEVALAQLKKDYNLQF